MKTILLIVLIILIQPFTFCQDTTKTVQIELGLRTKKYVGFYWVNGLSAEFSTYKIAKGSLHLGVNLASSSLGSAIRSNAIPTLETELSIIKYFRYTKSFQPITRLNLGYSKAFYGEGFSNITSNSILCSIEAGFKYIIMSTVSANIYGGYNILTGNGINGLGTIYPIYSGVSLNWLLSTKSKIIQK
jgi:hypothetical protein